VEEKERIADLVPAYSMVPRTRSRFFAWSFNSFWIKFGSRLYCCKRERAKRASSAVSSFWVEAARTSFSFFVRFLRGLDYITDCYMGLL
jgi:hypothetical protein